MIEVTKFGKKVALMKARNELDGLSDRQTIEKIDKFERASNPKERLVGIAMRSILMGDTEQSFKKACKIYQKSTSEHVRCA